MKARKKVFGRVRIRSRADARVHSRQHRRKRREDPKITKDVAVERFGDEALQGEVRCGRAKALKVVVKGRRLRLRAVEHCDLFCVRMDPRVAIEQSALRRLHALGHRREGRRDVPRPRASEKKVAIACEQRLGTHHHPQRRREDDDLQSGFNEALIERHHLCAVLVDVRRCQLHRAATSRLVRRCSACGRRRWWRRLLGARKDAWERGRAAEARVHRFHERRAQRERDVRGGVLLEGDKHRHRKAVKRVAEHPDKQAVPAALREERAHHANLARDLDVDDGPHPDANGQHKAPHRRLALPLGHRAA